MRYVFFLVLLTLSGISQASQDSVPVPTPKPTPIQLPPSCAPHAEFVALLERDHKEHPAAFGVMAQGQAILEIYSSDEGGFTVLATGHDGRTCVLAAGSGWEVLVGALGRTGA